MKRKAILKIVESLSSTLNEAKRKKRRKKRRYAPSGMLYYMDYS